MRKREEECEHFERTLADPAPSSEVHGNQPVRISRGGGIFGLRGGGGFHRGCCLFHLKSLGAKNEKKGSVEKGGPGVDLNGNDRYSDLYQAVWELIGVTREGGSQVEPFCRGRYVQKPHAGNWTAWRGGRVPQNAMQGSTYCSGTA